MYNPDVIRSPSAENRSTWATNMMALYSLVVGIMALLLDFMFGIGFRRTLFVRAARPECL
jgi:hypothetical protein